ncbi:unnamed protein product [Prorocentrum cordatum]|uniref:Uncharacterized protein n=1 Tax=Prorocentrum cordatum TaxID=2364126 RepID=A0ABN9YH25_9DINO|nr:unnamed protein product [Polarella glacialis]
MLDIEFVVGPPRDRVYIGIPMWVYIGVSPEASSQSVPANTRSGRPRCCNDHAQCEDTFRLRQSRSCLGWWVYIGSPVPRVYIGTYVWWVYIGAPVPWVYTGAPWSGVHWNLESMAGQKITERGESEIIMKKGLNQVAALEARLPLAGAAPPRRQQEWSQREGATKVGAAAAAQRLEELEQQARSSGASLRALLEQRLAGLVEVQSSLAQDRGDGTLAGTRQRRSGHQGFHCRLAADFAGQAGPGVTGLPALPETRWGHSGETCRSFAGWGAGPVLGPERLQNRQDAEKARSLARELGEDEGSSAAASALTQRWGAELSVVLQAATARWAVGQAGQLRTCLGGVCAAGAAVLRERWESDADRDFQIDSWLVSNLIRVRLAENLEPLTVDHMRVSAKFNFAFSRDFSEAHKFNHYFSSHAFNFTTNQNAKHIELEAFSAELESSNAGVSEVFDCGDSAEVPQGRGAMSQDRFHVHDSGAECLIINLHFLSLVLVVRRLRDSSLARAAGSAASPGAVRAAACAGSPGKQSDVSDWEASPPPRADSAAPVEASGRPAVLEAEAADSPPTRRRAGKCAWGRRPSSPDSDAMSCFDSPR